MQRQFFIGKPQDNILPSAVRRIAPVAEEARRAAARGRVVAFVERGRLVGPALGKPPLLVADLFIEVASAHGAIQPRLAGRTPARDP